MAPPKILKGPVTTLYFRRLSKKKKRIFAAWCAMRGITLQEGFEQFIDIVTKVGTCLWCGGSGERSHPMDKGMLGSKCSMCEGTGVQTQMWKPL